MTLTYSCVGVTAPDRADWHPVAPRFRLWQGSGRVGSGQACFERAAAAVLRWEVKTRSGFRVTPEEVRLGARPVITVGLGRVRITEPVRVVAVVHESDRIGFAYGTESGHPVSGEEAFVVHRDAAGDVWLTVRSVTRPGRGGWRPLFPVLLIAQRVVRRRYLRALRE